MTNVAMGTHEYLPSGTYFPCFDLPDRVMRPPPSDSDAEADDVMPSSLLLVSASSRLSLATTALMRTRSCSFAEEMVEEEMEWGPAPAVLPARC